MEQRFAECRQQHTGYTVVVLNVRNFKFINELFGRANGDKLLCCLKNLIGARLTEEEFFCRDTADQFYLFLRDTDTERVHRRLSSMVRHASDASRSDAYGYEVLLYCAAAVEGELFQALLALRSICQRVNDTIAFYSAEIHKQELLDNYIESHMQLALENGEFK